jgi:long-chain acyl-CoA synthetase
MTIRTHRLFDALRTTANAEPSRPAFRLIDTDGSMLLDFGGLADRIGQLGNALHSAGYRDGERVAIFMENRPAWPVAYLATWYAGAITVPIDVALEPHAIRRVLQHSGARICLTSRAMTPKLVEACAQIDEPPLLLDVDGAGDRRWDGTAVDGGVPIAAGEPAGSSWDELIERHEATSEWSPHARADAVATIMYTSGTTGTPKGVALSHEALDLNVQAGLERIEVSGSDKILAVLPLFHALPLTTNCLGPIARGAEVVFLAELNPDRIIAAFRTHDITVFACVPLFFYRFHDRVMKGIQGLPGPKRRLARMMLRVNRFARSSLGINLGHRFFGAVHKPFGTLRLFISGGAKFNPQVYQDFVDLGFTLVQGYGLTEGTAGLTAHPIKELRADTVGRALDGIELRIDTPDNEGIGEIVARTPSRMAGYYLDDDATAAVFDGEWLRTGDLGRLLPDGHLQVTGRAKDVIVLASGKNIYPEELEAFYGQSPYIDEICILGIDDPRRRGSERLHAVVVPDLEHARRQGQVNVREMVMWELEGLGIQLPGPQRVTSLEIRGEPLPRTTTRKIKRFELKREVLGRQATSSPADGSEAAEAPTIVPPDDVSDEAGWVTGLREIVGRHARVESVRRSDHLDLDLGLESLDRVELQAEVEAAFDIRLPADEATGIQTVGDLIDLAGHHIAVDAKTRRPATDRWTHVLAAPPPDVEPYLRRRPIGEALLRGVFAIMRTALRLFGFRVGGLENLPREAPFILAPNHVSFVDPFLLTLALPREVFDRIYFVGYSAYFRGHVLGYLGKLLRTIPIDQNRNLESAMQAAAEGLRREMVLGIFPEGGRSNDGTVKEFRRGVAILGSHLDVPVVPVGLWGAYEMWPREGRWRPHRTAVYFGEPLQAAPEATREEQDRFVAHLREQVVELVGAARDQFDAGAGG